MNDKYKSEIISYSQELGFCKTGFAGVEPFTTERNVYKNWLSEGKHGSMKYMEKSSEYRFDPLFVLEGCKTAIVVAINYYSPNNNNDTVQGSGKLARYAWGRDYHKVIREKLEKLSQKISELFLGSKNRYFTDSNYLAEKTLAVRAGIGWQGKNSLIITKEYGSWIFLGVLLTTVEFEPDPPSAEHCGKCTRCLDTCPTKAFIKPKLLDATKCLSYWTIETKPSVEIPQEIIEHSDSWIYGCDICQEVCPWNRFEKPTDEVEFSPKEERMSLEADAIKNMDKSHFIEMFGDSAVRRIKLKGLKRNACMIK